MNETPEPQKDVRPVPDTLPEGIAFEEVGPQRWQVRHVHRIVGTIVGSGSHWQAFTPLGRALGSFSTRREAVSTLLDVG